jgi:hypothetical protein
MRQISLFFSVFTAKSYNAKKESQKEIYDHVYSSIKLMLRLSSIVLSVVDGIFQ